MGNVNDRAEIPASTRAIYATFDYVGANRGFLAAWLLGVVAAALLLSGFHIVKKEELGLKTRFGRVVETNIEPGLHYAIPIVEKTHARKVERIERQRVSSRTEDSDEAGFTILSGDTNLLEVDLVLQYKIGNLRDYLFAAVDPHAIVSMFARQSLVDILGQNYIDLIFTENRSVIESYLFERTVAQLEANGTGVELVALNIVDLAPVAETVDAFRDVSDAIAERLQMISNAHRESEKMVARSRGQAEAVRQDAEAKARERVTQAKSAAKVFLALLASYRSEPSQVALTRYWQRMRTIFAEATLQAVNPKSDSTIDINMIDSGAGFTPASLLAGAPATAAAVPMDERPLVATLQRTAPHRFESIADDRAEYDGRFHVRGTERDHMQSANPRSLIFDSPSMFAHRHVKPGSPVAREGSREAPIIEQAAEALAAAEQTAAETPADPGKADVH